MDFFSMSIVLMCAIAYVVVHIERISRLNILVSRLSCGAQEIKIRYFGLFDLN